MKHSLTILTTCLFLCAQAFTAAAEDGKHLFILSGQSNMAKLDPNVSFTPAVETALGKENVIVVKDAMGGQPILRWYKKWKPVNGEPPQATGDLYDRLMTKVNTAIKGQKLASVTFVWMQGERDSKDKQGDVYAASLKGLVEQLRTDMKRPDINFVIGRINDCQINNPDWIKVRKAQVAVAEADSRGAWVDTDDLNDEPEKEGMRGNGVHCAPAGYKLMGERFAKKALELIKKQVP